MVHQNGSPDSIASMVLRHDQILLDGDNRKPGLTIRMETAENKVDSLEKAQAKYDRKQNAMITLLLATLTGIIVELFKH